MVELTWGMIFKGVFLIMGMFSMFYMMLGIPNSNEERVSIFCGKVAVYAAILALVHYVLYGS